MVEYVILVDENDKEVGIEEKMDAHIKRKLHRAFSIFVYNSKGELLLQQREKSKYHCGGLWTNTCCSHPRPGEELKDAIHRRLKEEMGFDCELKEKFSFLYKAKFDNGLTENELDHVFVGFSDKTPNINLQEVEDYKLISISDLKKDILKNPDDYTSWFKMALKKLHK
ncbi:MAG: isopentenyl-diphosphate Delta-isomerase [Nanoarchaeota archaeon]|nr:isopentenyl-diphosphate Delta-isomerase [Nanoarchaeota archaeon]MBU1269711.1 isopentenyl-diphosphate Delta-isomerase [Nanoarchaeota archaeon]MBU1604012.1 isopentenyl-diphosphate Delta-isomerase [Nanoarchaeota archaeon]MBU2442529.1 isopentenyl-diphosphate Delta-isomerase [Nanoarchaeota archaeon]